MNKMLLAVFGHYDSRGGTTGIPLDNRTREAVEAAITSYNESFDWAGTLKDYEKDPTGWAWNPTLPYSSPAHNDFMFIAELHYEGDLPDGDLEESGLVLIDTSSEPKFDGIDRGEFCGEQFELLIKLTLKRPTQLEYVPVEGGKYTEQERVGADTGDSDDRKWREHVRALARFIDRRPDFPKLAGIYVDDRNWNDDAFGFIIGTGL